MIRAAQKSDVPAMLAIYSPYVEQTTASFEYTPPDEAEFARRLEQITEKLPWIVCEQEGQVLGYAYASLPFGRAAYSWCCETSIYVRRDARGRGIGRALYRALEPLLEMLGYRKVYAVVTSENEKSLAFHRAAGYEQIAQLPGCGMKFGRWLGTTWLEKQLGSVEIPMKKPERWQVIVEDDRKRKNILDKMPLF